MSTQYLNLDDIEQDIDKTVRLNGVDYKFHPFTVDEFIAQLKEVEALEASSNISASELTEFSIKVIRRGFPDMPEADIRKLPMTKLKALSDFVRDEVKEDSAASAEAAPGTPEGNAQGAAS